MWVLTEKLVRRFIRHLPWQAKYLCGKAGIGGIDISIDRHFEYAFVINRLKNIKKGLLVDIGGAGSLLSPMLAALGHEVIGYDLHPWSLIFPRYEHRAGDACKMHFGDAIVDICISISCIEHLGDRRYCPDCRRSDRLLIEEILRILKPGGILIISVPYGIAQELPPHRVYDEMGIRELTKGLIERYREIYVPVDNESLFHYRIGSEEEAHMKRPWFRYSVIAIELQKPVKRLEL